MESQVMATACRQTATDTGNRVWYTMLHQEGDMVLVKAIKSLSRAWRNIRQNRYPVLHTWLGVVS